MSEADFYRENGYVHARGVFDAAEVDEMRTAIDRILADVEGTASDANHGWTAAQKKETVLKGFHNVQYHDASFTRAATHPHMIEVLTQLIGPNVQLHHTKMLVKPPEKGAPFPMHQDYPYFPHERHTVVAASVRRGRASRSRLREVPRVPGASSAIRGAPLRCGSERLPGT